MITEQYYLLPSGAYGVLVLRIDAGQIAILVLLLPIAFMLAVDLWQRHRSQ